MSKPSLELVVVKRAADSRSRNPDVPGGRRFSLMRRGSLLHSVGLWYACCSRHSTRFRMGEKCNDNLNVVVLWWYIKFLVTSQEVEQWIVSRNSSCRAGALRTRFWSTVIAIAVTIDIPMNPALGPRTSNRIILFLDVIGFIIAGLSRLRWW